MSEPLFWYYRNDPRGAESFPQWLNDRVWELLQRQARIDWWYDDEWHIWHFDTAASLALMIPFAPSKRLRIVLLDGTVIKEWSGSVAASEAATGPSSMAAVAVVAK